MHYRKNAQSDSVRISRYIWQPERTVALKIINNHDPKSSHHERAIEELVAQRIPSHRGNVITRTCLESFEVAGPEGRHLCLVYEPMREPLWILQRRFDDHRLLLPIAKAYIYFCLVGLDYLHTECKVAHTGNLLSLYGSVGGNINILTANYCCRLDTREHSHEFRKRTNALPICRGTG